VPTLQEIYREGARRLGGLDESALESRILLRHVTNLTPEAFERDHRLPLSFQRERAFFRLIKRRLSGVPTAYLTGVREFWSIPLHVRPGVLIPRPETELILEKALETRAEGMRLAVDIGTGCGCLALVLAREFPGCRVLALDISRKALRVARMNARRLAVSGIEFLRGDLFAPLEGRGLSDECDLIVSNPPYVTEKEWGELAREIRDHEPRRALVAGVNGLEIIEKLILGAGRYLRKGGRLIFEIGLGQSDRVLDLFGEEWRWVRPFDDLAGIPRVIVAEKRD